MLHAFALVLAVSPIAQSDGYRLPPQEVIDIVDAAPTPSVSISPDHQRMLLIERSAMPSIDEISRPWVGLAGLRIDAANNGRQAFGLNTGLRLRKGLAGEAKPIELPAGARITTPRWSHTSQHFGFTIVEDTNISLWVCDANTGEARELTAGLNTIHGGGWRWMPDGNSILAHVIPTERGPAPAKSRVPSGPATQETAGDRSPVRTYQDLLSTPYDEALFAHLSTSQLEILSVDGTRAEEIGPPSMILSAAPSPNGEYLLVTRMERPVSYLMSYRSFPRSIEVWGVKSGERAVMARIPLAEGIPLGGVTTEPRNFQWRAGVFSTLVWVQALDGGDPKAEAKLRDQWWMAPIGAEPRRIIATGHRASGLTWMADPDLVLASEYDRDRRWTRTTLYDLGSEDAEPVVLDDRSVQDRYGNPGSLVTEADPSGRSVVRQDGDWVYRRGAGDSPEGQLPFLDRQNLKTLETERLWRCEPKSYERAVALLAPEDDGAMSRFLTVHESKTQPPNYFLRDLRDPKHWNQLTQFADPTPQLRGITKQLVKYERADGVPLSATLYLPADHQEGQELPLVVWAYPREFNDPSTAGQVTGSPWRFTRIRGSSHLFFLTQGYAIMDGATMPIIGDAETMNDTFIDQIVSSAQAAIDKAVDMGVADGTRVGVGGHSYGAFMTANLLAHCDLFDAGLARSGAYNRTLTPFGFQSERRTLWEAPDAYAKISPFFHADKINEPMLMIHGAKDNNSGTYPIQSERMYHAIKGNGGKARLVMLPEESHGYRARESVLHTLAEMIDWFDRHVKGPAHGAPVEASSADEGR
jgi:dipeptidyl aminopeptidase/acylaminoacyl peptidase